MPFDVSLYDPAGRRRLVAPFARENPENGYQVEPSKGDEWNDVGERYEHGDIWRSAVLDVLVRIHTHHHGGNHHHGAFLHHPHLPASAGRPAFAEQQPNDKGGDGHQQEPCKERRDDIMRYNAQFTPFCQARLKRAGAPQKVLRPLEADIF